MGNCKGSKGVQPVTLLATLDDSIQVALRGSIPSESLQNNNNNNVNPDSQSHINNNSTNENVGTEVVEPSSSDESTSTNEIEVTATSEMHMDNTNNDFNGVTLDEKPDGESLDDDQNTAPGAFESKTSDEHA